MKKNIVILAVIAAAAMTAISCQKQEDPAITNIKKACVGTWVGEIDGDEIEVTFTSAGKITCSPQQLLCHHYQLAHERQERLHRYQGYQHVPHHQQCCA